MTIIIIGVNMMIVIVPKPRNDYHAETHLCLFRFWAHAGLICLQFCAHFHTIS